MIRKQWMKILTAGILSLLVLTAAGCRKKADIDDELLVFASIWAAPYVNLETHEVDFSAAPYAVQLQRRGFDRGMDNYPTSAHTGEMVVSEQEKFENVVERLAEVYSTHDVLMTVGASSDLVTMYSAMETNYFNIPYLIPFSDGDVLGGGPQGYNFRLTVTGSDYADYIGNNILPGGIGDVINSVLFHETQTPDYSVTAGVFFSDMFNDHDTAVKITQKLMDNGIDVQYHMAYSSGNLFGTVSKCWNDEFKGMPEIDVIFILGEDYDQMPDIPAMLHLWDDQPNSPSLVLIDYTPENYPPEVAGADNVFILQQHIDRTTCPADITVIDEALGYAAGYLTMRVLDDAVKNRPEKPGGIQYLLMSSKEKLEAKQNYLDTYRGRVRNSLASQTGHIPCFGEVNANLSWDGSTKLELVRITASGTFEQVDPSEILSRIIGRVASQYGISR